MGPARSRGAMDVRQLRYFLGVLEAKSFTKAAEILYVAQPAIGMQIRKLEEELGVKLLVRHSRGVAPTEAGAVLKARAEALLLELDNARQEIVEIGTEPRGTITVGMTTSVMLTVAADLVGNCRRKYPDLSLNIVEAMSRQLVDQMLQKRVDIALTFRTPDDGTVESEPLVDEVLCLVAPADHPVAAASEVTMDEVLTYDFISYSRKPSFFLASLENAAKAKGVELRIACQTDSVEVMKELVRNRIGCGVAPPGAVKWEVDARQVVAVPIVKPDIKRTLHMAYVKERHGSRTMTAVSDEIRAIVDGLVAAGDVGWRPAARKGKAAASG